jgi:peptidoglycan/xylan/chitin deacetylase (PgdA/CDA1 family)
LIGQNLKYFPQIGQQVVADGHAIGNHTWHHWHRPMNQFTAIREVEDTSALIYKTTGVKTSLFRPPNGFLNNGLAAYARRLQDAVVLWSVDSGDWRGHRVSVRGLVNQVIEKARPGGIVLMHDGGGDRSKTVEALPKIIEELAQRGYKFVTVPELLRMQN